MSGKMGTILLAVPGEGEVEAPLRKMGFRIIRARNGAEALDLTISRRPDVVVFDEGCEVVDHPSFVRIVRSNPRTSKIPILVLQRPFEERRILAAIEEGLARGRGESVPRKERMASGTLHPLTVPDLLQAFMGRRETGKIVLHSAVGEGVIWVGEGEIRDARLGEMEGRKALFRLLTVEEGSFELRPATLRPSRIGGRLEFLLLEAARQKDELVRVRGRLPPGRTRVVATVDPSSVPHPSPLFLPLLRQTWGRRVSLERLIDGADVPDLEVALALEDLLRIGWIRPVDETEDEELLLEKEPIGRLRRRLAEGGRPVGTVLVVSDREEDLRLLLHHLGEVPAVRIESDGSIPSQGTVASLDLGGGLVLDLVALPIGEEMGPWAMFLAGGALGALVAGTGDGFRRLGLDPSLPRVEADPQAPLPSLRRLLSLLAGGEHPAEELPLPG